MKNKTLSVLLLAVFLTLFGWYFITHLEDFRILQNINPLLVIVILAGHVGSIFSNGLFNKAILKSYGKRIDLIESYVVSLTSTIGNFFLPIGSGTSLRAIYLKRKHNFNYGDFISTLYGNYLIAFSLSALIGILGLASLPNNNSNISIVVLVIFIAILGGCIVLSSKKLSRIIVERLEKVHKLSRVVGIIKRIISGWIAILKNKKLLLTLAVFTLVNYITQVVINLAAFHAIGVQTSIGSLLVYTSIGALSLLVNITPASIGIKESIFLFSSSVIGLTTTQILSIALIDRSIRFIVIFVSWLIFRKKLQT